MQELYNCPLCKRVPMMGYACGDYFVHCTDHCAAPMCDHPAREATVSYWNHWVTRCNAQLLKTIASAR